jgi:hypothetical protein
MRHPELLPAFATGFAVAVARLRWVLLTRTHCRSCRAQHLHCECKPGWVRILL